MLPWFKAPTSKTYTEMLFHTWTEPVPEYVAMYEYLAILAIGVPGHWSRRRLSDRWRQSEAWARRIIGVSREYFSSALATPSMSGQPGYRQWITNESPEVGAPGAEAPLGYRQRMTSESPEAEQPGAGSQPGYRQRIASDLPEANPPGAGGQPGYRQRIANDSPDCDQPSTRHSPASDRSSASGPPARDQGSRGEDLSPGSGIDPEIRSNQNENRSRSRSTPPLSSPPRKTDGEAGEDVNRKDIESLVLLFRAAGKEGTPRRDLEAPALSGGNGGMAPDGEKTHTLGPDGEKTHTLAPDGEKTHTLGPDGEKTHTLAPADEKAQLIALAMARGADEDSALQALEKISNQYAPDRVAGACKLILGMPIPPKAPMSYLQAMLSRGWTPDSRPAWTNFHHGNHDPPHQGNYDPPILPDGKSQPGANTGNVCVARSPRTYKEHVTYERSQGREPVPPDDWLEYARENGLDEFAGGSGLDQSDRENGLDAFAGKKGLGQFAGGSGLDQFARENGLDQFARENGLDQLVRENGLDESREL